MLDEKRARLMKLYGWASRDTGYTALDIEFQEAQKAFALVLEGFTAEEREVVELFLMRYAARSHYLLDMALMMPK